MMTRHTTHPAAPPAPSLWARLATWLAVVVLLCGSVAEAGHLHRMVAKPGTGAGHAAITPTPDGDGGTTCPLCLLDGSAVPVHVLRSLPMLYRARAVPQIYSSRSVPLSVPFALSNRPPPTV